jgi:hypothetical protein
MGDCLNRSRGDRGSSRHKLEYKDLGGIFNVSPIDNPYFYDYTMIHANYCDGTGH